MSNTSLTYLIAASVGVFSVALWAAFVLVPAWTAYARVHERLLAAFLSLYVLAGFALVGAGVGATFLWYFDQL